MSPHSVGTRRILIVDDDEALRMALAGLLRTQGYQIHDAESAEAMFSILRHRGADLLVLDLMLEDGESLQHLPRLRSEYPATQILMVTGSGTIDTAVTALRQGVFDFVTKPVDTKRLLHSIRGALKLARSSTSPETARSTPDPAPTERDLLGTSPAMNHLRNIIRKIASSSCSVLIVGESGTGKELVARAIHGGSPRKDRPMPAVNCGALPGELMESELFGHEKGAFTGASQARMGFAELGDQGTLFLDEIGEIPIDLQPKLLRFLQEKTFHRVGSTREQKVDVRVVCATNRDPGELVRQGGLREDLYYRISQVVVRVPALRERTSDIPDLAMTFLRRAAKEEGRCFETIEDEAMAVLQAYHWPGNVRHLLNVITEVVVLHDGTTITPSMLPYDIALSVKDQQPQRELGQAQDPQALSEIRPLWKWERQAIKQALLRTGGNVALASAQLEISPATLYRKIKRYDIAGSSPTVNLP